MRVWTVTESQMEGIGNDILEQIAGRLLEEGSISPAVHETMTDHWTIVKVKPSWGKALLSRFGLSPKDADTGVAFRIAFIK